MSEALRVFETGAASDVGKVRSRNEDAFLVSGATGVFAVADGMGGHEGGQLASATVIGALRKIAGPAPLDDLLVQCRIELDHANRHLQQVGSENDGITIGTTVAALLASANTFACVWSGDSRIYLIRDAMIEQLSHDHTEVAELVAEGVLSEEEAQNWPRRNVVTRAIGVYPEVEIEIVAGNLERDDIFVICSDGLTTHVSDGEILEHARNNGAQNACDALVSLTLQRGATDNVTVVMIRFAQAAMPER